MRYQKFVCKSKTCLQRTGGKPRVWYLDNRERARRKEDVNPVRCISCGKTLPCVGLQKSTPTRGIDMSSRLAQRQSEDRQMRKSILKAQRELKKMKQLSRMRGILSDEEDDDPWGLDVSDSDDDEYAPPARFNPNMRLTKGSQRKVLRSLYAYDTTLTKVVGRIQVTSSHTRSMSSTNQNAVMGLLILGKGTLSAWQHAGRTDYLKDRYKSAEWCHLVADCLGGPTSPTNLVAASFAANTEMMAIENLLMGRTAFQVRVEARCDTAHVAERILYNVYCKKSHHWLWEIDGQNDYFTKADLDDVRDGLKDYLGTHKSC